jgi:fatty acid-binding protein DegV
MQPRHPALPVPSARSRPTYEADAYAKSPPGVITRESRVARTALPAAATEAALVTVSDAARTLLVADASCDLPEHWLSTNRVLVLPLRIRTATDSLTDGRAESDVPRRSAFLAATSDIGAATHSVIALSAAGIEALIAEQLTDKTDFILAITQAARRGAVHSNALSAAQRLMQRIAQARHQQASRQRTPATPFKMWVVDGDAPQHAHAILVCEAQRLLADGARVPHVVQRLDALRHCLQAVVLPADLRHLHAHGVAQADRALSWLSYGVDRMLNRTPVLRFSRQGVDALTHHRDHIEALDATLQWTAQQVVAGLAAPHVCVSVAGDPLAVARRDAWSALAACCRDVGVALQLSTMSISNTLSLGRGAVAIALAVEPDEPAARRSQR